MKRVFLLLAFAAMAFAQPVSLTPPQAAQEVCVWDTAVFALNASGPDGDYAFALNGSAKWGTIVPKAASLRNYEEVYAYFTPGCFEKTGTYGFQAVAAGTAGRATSILTLHVVPCASLFLNNSEITGKPPGDAQKLCLGEKKTLSIVLKNKSKTSPVKYSAAVSGASAGVSVPSAVSAGPAGETPVDVVFDSAAAGLGSKQFSVSFTGVHPETGKQTEDTAVANFAFDVQSCASAQISLNESGQKCSDAESSYPVTIKNTGRDALFTARVSNMSFSRLSETTFFLKNGESKTIELIVDLGVKPRSYQPKITVASEYDSYEITPVVDYKKCWDVALNGLGGEVCQCEDKSFTFDVINTGAFADSYDVYLKQAPGWFKPNFFNDTRVSLKSGQKKTLASAMFDCNAVPSAYTVMFGAVAQSKKSSDDLGIDITVRPKSVCYIAGFDAQSEYARVGESKRIAILVRNTGIIDNVYTLSLDAPAWALLSQDVLQLKRGGSEDVFVTLNPTSESAGRAFTFRVKAVSKDVVSFKDFEVRVLAEGESAPAEEAQYLEADVAYDAGVFSVSTEDGALVSFVSPSGATETVAAENGIAKIKANETGSWTIRVEKEGFEPLEMAYDAQNISPFSGLFSAGSNGPVIAVIILIALGVAAFAYYRASAKK